MWFRRTTRHRPALVHRFEGFWFWRCRMCPGIGYGSDIGSIHDAARHHMRRKHA